MSEISFQFYRGLLYLPISLVQNGGELILKSCIFDTGSAGTTFDTDEVSKIGIQSTPQSRLKRLVTVGGYQTVFTSNVKKLILGEVVIENIEVEVGNLHSKFGIQGIIGTDLMRRFDWEIRFSDKVIVLR
ncbi:MAG: retropepsin-like aspartic protease [Deltaproteobacteria bacterium]|nr:retropepsin-like aspartic protease [Deltaproteobacteria bacterium]